MKFSKKSLGFVLTIVVISIWSWVYGRLSLDAWTIPIIYGGDGWLGLGFAKAFMDGDISPVLHKSVAHLGAPFSANWNDYPLTEEVIFAIIGWSGRVVGLFPAANFVELLAHILAALSFFYVGRVLKYRTAFVFSGAILFAFTHYIFARGFSHIVLSYYWHLPLVILVSWWCYSSEKIAIKDQKFFIAVAVSIITGVFNPYYAWMYLQFLGFAVLLHVAKKQYQLVKTPLILIFTVTASFFLMNLDTISYSWLHGSNAQAVSRSLGGLEIYGLKIPELIFPPGYHAWKSWAEYGQNHYFIPSLIKGEMGSPYLGLVGLFGFVWLIGMAVYRLLKGRPQTIPVHAWQILWILLFSLIGGINLVLGTFGIVLFRGTNRYSIFILTIVLLFLVRQFSKKCPEKLVYPVAFCMTFFGLWDQLPPHVTADQVHQVAEIVRSDSNFAKSMESKLNNTGMVFQLPVASFPEEPPIFEMGDYEHFRPYLYTNNLHYSYGANKGRGDADWQISIAELNPKDMISKLEKIGFSAILINRRGYKDRGAKLVENISILRGEILLENENFIAFKLNPNVKHEYPDSLPIFGTGWSTDEGSHRWAVAARTEIKYMNYSQESKPIKFEFSLSTLKPRFVNVLFGDKILERIALRPGDTTAHSKMLSVNLNPGLNTFVFKTDVPPDSPGTGDPRVLTFSMSGLKFYEDKFNGE